jgi:hypothetical protein
MTRCAITLTVDAAIRYAEVRREIGLPARPVVVLATTPTGDRHCRSAVTMEEALEEIPDGWEIVASRGVYPSDLEIAREIGWAKCVVCVWRGKLTRAGLWSPPMGHREWRRRQRGVPTRKEYIDRHKAMRERRGPDRA